ncbi:leucine-rich repeat-containing protein 40 [Drosophila grimshawi]|uniref:GH21000 n=1 Tax=Drosophila grimshawi TaxID=7222 RepID=B4J530_DROGR|nr:leucine-rich repeat-containing protein 40 [Drosophila grimshawi]EDW00656.1 GH21000 [Drosophila grimshawi]
MVGDGLNSPRHQGGKTVTSENQNIFPDKYSMRNTRILNLKRVGLKGLSEDIIETACAELVNAVSLEDNLLTELPWELHRMSELLTDLDLSKNKVSFIHSFVSRFSRITRINLSCNLLRALPMEFAGLQTLCELNISHNRFDHLPSCIYELEKLEKLVANDNKIKQIDASDCGLGALRQLNYLNLNNNDIQLVPPVLGNLTNITKLKLSGNPFRQPRHQILASGTGAILNYLRGRIPM